MQKTLDLILIIGFLFIDFLFFHDVFKAGEVISLAQYLAGALSIVVILQAFGSLLRPR